jgi:type I restriction-modification system DNA methylase subunit
MFNRKDDNNKNKHNSTVGSDISRSDERIDETGEVFTPDWMCEHIVRNITVNKLKDPTRTFLDNGAGSGNFLVALKNILLEYHDEEHIINNMLYAVELMEDNYTELCERVGVSTDHPHYVCANAIEYDYSFGQPVGLEAFF